MYPIRTESDREMEERSLLLLDRLSLEPSSWERFVDLLLVIDLRAFSAVTDGTPCGSIEMLLGDSDLVELLTYLRRRCLNFSRMR